MAKEETINIITHNIIKSPLYVRPGTVFNDDTDISISNTNPFGGKNVSIYRIYRNISYMATYFEDKYEGLLWIAQTLSFTVNLKSYIPIYLARGRFIEYLVVRAYKERGYMKFGQNISDMLKKLNEPDTSIDYMVKLISRDEKLKLNLIEVVKVLEYALLDGFEFTQNKNFFRDETRTAVIIYLLLSSNYITLNTSFKNEN